MEHLRILRDASEVDALIEYLSDKEYVSFDTETNGINSDAEIIGYSICAENDVAYYVITAYWDKELQKLTRYDNEETSTLLMNYLTTKKLIMHNGLFDIGMVKNNYSIDLTHAFHTDTMVLAHILDENRRVGLKELGAKAYGQDAKKEQLEMKASVEANGGEMTKANYELYKGDADLIAKYGAKDAILTWNLFWEMVPELAEEGLMDFFYKDESMPLLKGPTMELNTTGLKVDLEALKTLQKQLEVEILESTAFVHEEIATHIADKYPGTTKLKTFNIGSGGQLAWLLFNRLEQPFIKVSNAGQELCRALGLKVPYNHADQRQLISILKDLKGTQWRAVGEVYDPKTRKHKGAAKVRDYWNYLSTDKVSLAKLGKKYRWVARLLELKKASKILNTYVLGIQEKTRYGIIHPQFKQTGTPGGRYSCKDPNFQNLPRDDKRIKACIVARPGKAFVGADYSQLEPRVFASYSQDKRLMECFASGEDFYSVTGVEIFNKPQCSLNKKDDNFFGKMFDNLRYKSKGVTLSATYGTTAGKLATTLEIRRDEAQEIINEYFAKFPSVEAMMLRQHALVKKQGYVENMFGRKRRLPDAKLIPKRYGNSKHSELPYEARKFLNLSVNFPIQSTSASIVNRSAIALYEMLKAAKIDAKLVLQVHDSLIVECNKVDAENVASIMQDAMENTCSLPGVALVAEPKIGTTLADV
jgi:DNA polymerase I-like protein with 3'-5' exonuclease and polymerase domains